MNQLLNELKGYLRIDGDVENTSLLTFLQSSVSVLKNAGVKQPSDYYLNVKGEDVFAQHRLAIMMLSTHFYENRTVYGSKNVTELPYGIQTIILQLKWVNPDELSAQ